MTRAFLFAALSLATASAGYAALPPAPAQRDMQLRPCKLPDITRQVQCGILRVSEDADRAGSRRIPIHFAILSATSGKPRKDAIAVLMGGPGESAIEAAAVFADWLSPMLRDRDLVLMDQRGTGQSAPLRCELYSSANPGQSLRDFFPVVPVERCRRKLEKRADLSRYTNLDVAGDLERLRRRLGYGQLNLFAGSYGTRAAQSYMRSHPAHVRTAYLGSVVPLDSGGPLHFAKTEDAALERMLANCKSDRNCSSTFPHLRDELRQILGQLESGGVSVRVPGTTTPVPLGRGRVAEWFRVKLYRPSSSADLPWIIHRAFAGDWTPIAEGILENARGGDRNLSLGALFSITCSEDLAFVSEAEVVAESRETVLGDYRIRQQQAACRVWPKRPLPSGFRDPISSNIPTLFVTGDHDGGTPLWFTDRVAKHFASKAVVVARGQGHTEWNACVADFYERLLRSGSTRGLEGAVCPPVPLPPFKADGN